MVAAAEVADHDALDVLGGGGEIGLGRADHGAALIAVEACHGVGVIRRALGDDHQFGQAAVIQVAHDEFVIADADELLGQALCKGIDGNRAHDLVRNRSANDQFQAGVVVHVGIFHHLEGRAAAFDGLHQLVALFRFLEDVDLQGLLIGATGEEQVFRFSVAIQIRLLDGLLVLAGGGGCVFEPHHGAVNGILQVVILGGPLGQGIHLLHRRKAAAAQTQHRRQEQRREAFELFHVPQLLSTEYYSTKMFQIKVI